MFNLFRKYALFALWILSALPAIASGGGDAGPGNGGDICENRFSAVRNDLLLWLTQGGATELGLPAGLTPAQYRSSMLTGIDQAQISCVDETVKIEDAEKTCKNFRDSSGRPRILCNRKAFLETKDDDQYVLVHHEYAGLAGFEVNKGEASQYPISNQISGFLESQVARHLVVKAPGAQAASDSQCVSYVVFGDKNGDKVVRGPSLSMAGTHYQKSYLTGHTNAWVGNGYEVTARTDGQINLSINMGRLAPDGKNWLFGINTYSTGFTAGQSFTDAMYNNGGALAQGSKTCQIFTLRVVCAATAEYANRILLTNGAGAPIQLDQGTLPEKCWP